MTVGSDLAAFYTGPVRRDDGRKRSGIPSRPLRGARRMADSNCDIAGKTVLITGAGGGVGQALVQAFLEAGAGTVLAAGRTPPAAASRVVPVRLDVTDPASIA